jgi:hypothetical protein
LSLLLPIATATVKRVFFFPAMHVIKSRLRDMMRYKWINDSLVVYIEKNIFDDINNEVIMK